MQKNYFKVGSGKMKTKVIALDWQWVTLRSWCQMNHNGYSSPINNKVGGKPHQILEKLKITSGKSTLFGHFFVKFFWITCVHICISLNTIEITLILHTCLTLCWSCLCSIARYLVDPLWFWVVRVKKKEKKSVKLVQGKEHFFENLTFNQFYDSLWYFFKWCSSH